MSYEISPVREDLGQVPQAPTVVTPPRESGLMPVVRTGAQLAAIYHGYKRTGSVVWALIYGALARLSPIVTGVVIVAQGFGKPKGGMKNNPARRRRRRKNIATPPDWRRRRRRAARAAARRAREPEWKKTLRELSLERATRKAGEHDVARRIARGRELRRQGKSRREIEDILEREW